ncbi:cytochrome P450 ClCP1 [Bisporella sp. PMI_857]|nr:cytochrome P450 ClCP1 [Bisporella sp. PMI_857]
MDSMIQFGTRSLAVILASCASYLVYNLYFHPLRGFPGPFWSAATHFPYLYSLISGRISFDVLELHELYGNVVRIRPNELSYNNANAWKDIYGKAGYPGLEKDPVFFGAQNPPSGISSILTIDNNNHPRMRRLLNHAFSERALREQEPLVKVYIDLLIQQLRNRCNKGENQQDMAAWYCWTTCDIFGDLMFGESFGCVATATHDSWLKLASGWVKVGTVFTAVCGLIPGIQELLLWLAPKRIMAMRLRHHDFIVSKLKKRLQQSIDRADIISYILRHNDEREGMTLGEIESNANHMTIAGAETTATLLAGVTYYLLKSPEVLERVTAEVRGTFKDEHEITMVSVQSLKYMLAVLNEGFRMYPPVPTVLPRVTTGNGAIVNGRWVPPNTLLGVNQWAAYQSTTNFKDPSSFVPERWLGDARFESDNRDVLQPFSYGTRNCIGKNLSYAEMRLILAHVLWNFDIALAPSSESWNEQKMYGLWENGPLNVILVNVAR